jgi:hypothetical protein
VIAGCADPSTSVTASSGSSTSSSDGSSTATAQAHLREADSTAAAQDNASFHLFDAVLDSADIDEAIARCDGFAGDKDFAVRTESCTPVLASDRLATVQTIVVRAAGNGDDQASLTTEVIVQCPEGCLRMSSSSTKAGANRIAYGSLNVHQATTETDEQIDEEPEQRSEPLDLVPDVGRDGTEGGPSHAAGEDTRAKRAPTPTPAPRPSVPSITTSAILELLKPTDSSLQCYALGIASNRALTIGGCIDPQVPSVTYRAIGAKTSKTVATSSVRLSTRFDLAVIVMPTSTFKSTLKRQTGPCPSKQSFQRYIGEKTVTSTGSSKWSALLLTGVNLFTGLQFDPIDWRGPFLEAGITNATNLNLRVRGLPWIGSETTRPLVAMTAKWLPNGSSQLGLALCGDVEAEIQRLTKP